MLKEARKPSSDPVQEKLRSNKANLNKEVSGFIDDLIHFKKLMNGAPNKFSMEKGSIKNPIPADPNTIINLLADDFQKVVQKSNSIISDQINYSEKRRKSNKEMGPGTSNPTQHLMAFTDSKNIIIQASNPLSRFFSRLKGPWFGSSPEARFKKYRVSLLKIALEIDKQLSKLEAEIVKSSPESIHISGKIATKIEDNILFFNKTVEMYTSFVNKITKEPIEETLNKNNSLPENLPSKKTEEISKPLTEPINPEDISKVKAILLDFNRGKVNFSDLDPTLEKELNKLTMEFYLKPDPVSQKNIIPKIIETYEGLLKDINKKRGTNSTSLVGILINKKEASQLEVVANNFLNKWVGKVKHQLNPFDKTSPIRLDIYRITGETRKITNQIMDSVEDKLDVDELNLLLKSLVENILSIKELIKSLELTIKGKLLDKYVIDLMGEKEFGGVEMTQKQKEHLQRLMESKKLRELTKS